ncbi:MAG TPA: acyl--CoA ligase, partial [Bacillota bacterium]|nr:acyl--CoA ligase [Bacillota bacterium]
AFVVLKPNVDDSDPNLVKNLQDHVKELTAPYKYPRLIEFIEELPKTMSGKIRRVELRQNELKK